MKKFLLIALLFSACTTTVTTEDDSTAVENERLVRAMFEAFNAHAWEKMADYYADSASFLDPSFGIDYVIRSKTETASKYKEMESIFPDIRDDLKEVYTYGDKVIAEFVSTGTAPDGSRFTLPIVSILTVRDGKIVKDATYYDNSGSTPPDQTSLMTPAEK
ncbi:MAG: nuclear transport factor 2 family protein [Bacteroidota bacterium]